MDVGRSFSHSSRHREEQRKNSLSQKVATSPTLSWSTEIWAWGTRWAGVEIGMRKRGLNEQLSGSGFCDCFSSSGVLDSQETNSASPCYCLHNLNWFACFSHTNVHKDPVSTHFLLSVKKCEHFTGLYWSSHGNTHNPTATKLLMLSMSPMRKCTLQAFIHTMSQNRLLIRLSFWTCVLWHCCYVLGAL